jgi:hypothetical protein
MVHKDYKLLGVAGLGEGSAPKVDEWNACMPLRAPLVEALRPSPDDEVIRLRGESARPSR